MNIPNNIVSALVLEMDPDDKLSKDTIEQMLKITPTPDESKLFEVGESKLSESKSFPLSTLSIRFECLLLQYQSVLVYNLYEKS